MKTVFILIDSLNRRFLNCYGGSEGTKTPNIDRLAKRSVVFENHWCGSAPCMPARRDILTGRLNFLERPWGGIEPFDHILPTLLKEKNVYTHVETDHQFYNEIGGENYLCHFTSWNMHRGAEHDTINWAPDKSGIRKNTAPGGYTGMYSDPYEWTKKIYNGEKDRFSTPRTFNAAAQWLEKNHTADNFLLWIEGFDPHEPFDVDAEFLAPYGEPSCPEDPYWPDFLPVHSYTENQIKNFRRRYKGLLTMTDFYIGKILDLLDKYGMWDDTLVVLTTDHGYMLGEHGFVSKNIMPDYNEIYHLPLLISAPGIRSRRVKSLTQNIDLFPTFLETFGVSPAALRNPIHGLSLYPLLMDNGIWPREALLYGIFGKSVNIFDGRYTYLRRTVSPNNGPLFIYGSVMSLLREYIGYDTMSDEEIKAIETGRFLPWTKYPVYRVAAKDCHWKNNGLAFERLNRLFPFSMLFDLEEDYEQDNPLENPELEKKMKQKLYDLMKKHDAPKEQFKRLGL
jgi:arylsulfatase A-like enzyme